MSAGLTVVVPAWNEQKRLAITVEPVSGANFEPQWGLNEIWDAEYSAVGVKHISAGAWDPCNFATKDPIHSLADLNGKRVFTFPTAGRFLSQFGGAA